MFDKDKDILIIPPSDSKDAYPKLLIAHKNTLIISNLEKEKILKIS